MATIVELPRLSDTMEEGVVAEWRVKVGDKIKRGQVIADIETDKATMEFESFDAGIVLELVAKPGEVLPIGSPIAVFGKKGENAAEALSSHGGASAGKKPEAPRESASPAPAPVPVPASTPTASAAATPAAAPVAAAVEDGRIPASPIARKLAREAGIPLSAISGTGPHGRVVKSDVEAAAKGGGSASTGGAGAVLAAPSSFSSEVDAFGRPYAKRADTPQTLTLMRRTISKRMVQSQQQVPHFYVTIEIEMDEAAKLRQQLNLAVDGTKVSFNDLVVAAAAAALRVHPEVNAHWTDAGIVHYGNIDIGMAVAVDGGLIVPVVRNAEQKSLPALSRETRSLGKRAKTKSLKPEEMSGSTFSVSNLGMFGVHEFSAMVNPGEGAILAVGAVADGPAVRDGELVVRKLMRATLSCDHRVVDGALGARYLQTLKTILEQPMRLFAIG
jgi:pyruvate dehydrogenase E2 component (dihydrolipoamide acetyltransferase)